MHAHAQPPRIVAVALGGNTGDAPAAILRAFKALANSPLIESPRLSPLYRTAPVRVGPQGPDPGGDYTNAAAVAFSRANAHDLLDLLHAIELDGGRDRTHSPHGAPRAIDLDLLLVGDVRAVTPTLTLPHPRMHLRPFVLVPLADLVPDLHVPGTHATVAGLLKALGPIDPTAIQRIMA